jgi:hypothetical protein
MNNEKQPNYTITTDQGPSADNQTSNDHGLDSNQRARQASTEEVLDANGMFIDHIEDDGDTEDDEPDLSSARID